MSYIDDLNTAAEQALLASASATNSSQILYDVANGDQTTLVSTASGDVKSVAKAIKDISDSIGYGVAQPLSEEIILVEGQTEVSLSTVSARSMALYIEGAREFDYTVVDDFTFTLPESFPAGTRLWAVTREPEGGTAIGDLFFESAGGTTDRSLSDRASDKINLLDYGVTGDGSDESSKVQSAINTALSLGKTEIVCDDLEVNCASSLTGRGNVIFVGTGNLYGDGAYRRQVIPHTARRDIPSLGTTLDPAVHLRRVSLTASPKVAITGSSTGTFDPNAADTGSTLFNIIQTTLRASNRDKSFTFYNRSIGGTTFVDLDTTPDAYPEWGSSDPAREWIEYIEDVEPDLVIVVMGSNDSAIMSQSRLVSVTSKLKAFTKEPDIIYVTQPATNMESLLSGHNTKYGLEGRDYSAGIIRTYCQYNNIGLMDGNRLGGIVLDGRDILQTYDERVIQNLALPNGAYTSEDIECRDFSVRLKFEGDATDVDNAFDNSVNTANPPMCRVGAGGSGTSGDMFYIRKSGTKLALTLFTNNISGAYRTIATDIDFPTSSFSMDITKKSNRVTVSIVGDEYDSYYSFLVRAYGGVFYPRFSYWGASDGPWSEVTLLSVGVETPYYPQMTYEQAWGAADNDTTTKEPFGGNGVNHLSSIGTSLIYDTLFHAYDLKAPTHAEGEYVPEVIIAGGASEATPFINRWTKTGDVVTVSGYVSVVATSPSTQVRLRLSLPVPEDLVAVTNLSGVAASNTVLGAGAIFASADDDYALMEFNTSASGSQSIRYYYTYSL